jgi:hypothetical protein
MPSPQRNPDLDLELMCSWFDPNPTLGVDLEGWQNYHITENRLYLWNGTAWKMVVLSQVPTAEIADAAITAAKLATDAVTTVKIQDVAVTTQKISGDADAAMLVSSTTGVVSWGKPANYPAYPLFKDVDTLQWPKIMGTTFPTSPVDGQIFTHTTHRCMYYFDSVAAGWLSTAVFPFPFGAPSAIAATAYLGTGPSLTGDVQFTDTKGWRINVGVKLVGMSVQMNASGTCDLQVFDDGVGVTGGTLSLVTETFEADDTLMSATIAAKSSIGVKVTSGTLQGPAFGMMHFRRFET